MTRGFVAALAAVTITAALTSAGCMAGDDFDGVDDEPTQGDDTDLDTAGPRESLPPAVAGPCASQYTLHGLSETGRITVPSATFDTSGTTYCLTLDATENYYVAHFWAGAKQEDGEYSSFQLNLFDADGDLITEGWDVTYDVQNPRTHASLETGFQPGAVYEVKLHLRTRVGQAETDLDLALFEPFE